MRADDAVVQQGSRLCRLKIMEAHDAQRTRVGAADPSVLHFSFKRLQHKAQRTMSSPAPQLPRDDARALCAPANNLNTGFLQFDTAHEGDLVCTFVVLCIYCNRSLCYYFLAPLTSPHRTTSPHASLQHTRTCAPFPATNPASSSCATSSASSRRCSRNKRS